MNMRVVKKFVWGLVGAGAMAVALAGCGGSNTAPSGGGSGGGTGGGGGTSTTTITIANNAVSPKNITVTQGTQVTFTNSDNRTHEMNSDPHPEHTDCPEINAVGFLSVGQSRQTANMNTVRTCGFHDHNQNTVTALQGTITITAR
jgi:plastocyanin